MHWFWESRITAVAPNAGYESPFFFRLRQMRMAVKHVRYMVLIRSRSMCDNARWRVPSIPLRKLYSFHGLDEDSPKPVFCRKYSVG